MVEGTKVTDEILKDLEFVLGMAYSSEYLDSKSNEVCERVERFLKAIKAKNDRRNNLPYKCKI